MYIKIYFRSHDRKEEEFYVEKYSISGEFLILVVKDSVGSDRMVNHVFNLGEISKFISH